MKILLQEVFEDGCCSIDNGMKIYSFAAEMWKQPI